MAAVTAHCPRKDASWQSLPRTRPLLRPPRLNLARSPRNPGAPKRVSFAKIREPLNTPNLLDVQIQSFQWFTGDEAWFERRVEEGEENPVGGLEEVLNEISPIEDFSGSMSLSFSAPRFDEVKASIEECKDKDMTYAAPLFVTAEFVNNNTGEIKSQTVFLGDFPVMTDKGTFIINGTERVVVSQLVRSPGVYYSKDVDKTTDKDVFSVRVIPSRGAWLEFDVDKRDTVGVRIDRKRRQPVTVLLKALGWTTEAIRERFSFSETAAGDPREGPHRRHRRGPARHLPQAAPGRAAHEGERADPAGEPVLQGEALRPGEGRPVQGQQEARPDHAVRHRDADRRGHRHDHRVPGPAARRRGQGGRGERYRDPDRDRRHRSLRQPPPAHRRRADPEPDPGRPVAHRARRA